MFSLPDDFSEYLHVIFMVTRSCYPTSCYQNSHKTVLSVMLVLSFLVSLMIILPLLLCCSEVLKQQRYFRVGVNFLVNIGTV